MASTVRRIILGRKFYLNLLYGLILLFSMTCYAESDENAQVKQKIIQYIDDHTQDQIHFLKQIVNINSETENIEGVKEVGKVFQQQFADLGFKSRWITMPKSMERAGHLVAERNGNKGKSILILGHIDTVFRPNDPFNKFTLNNDVATGPGVLDNKGGDAVILYALKALQYANVLQDASITVILTGDEENVGKPIDAARRILQHAAEKADVALEFEWSNSLNSATVARRGQTSWLMTVKGKTQHSYLIFEDVKDKGSIYIAAEILSAFYENFVDIYGVSINPAIIAGGTSAMIEKDHGFAIGKKNIIPAKTVVSGDMRYISEQQKLSIMKQMQRIIFQIARKGATIEFNEKKLAMPLTLKNQELLLKFSQISDSLGYGKIEAYDPMKRDASDLSYVASIVPSNLAGLGPVGKGAHSSHESIDLNSLPITTKRAAMLLYYLINQ